MTNFNSSFLPKALCINMLWDNNSATNLARLSSALGDIRTHTHGLISNASQPNKGLSAAPLRQTWAYQQRLSV